MLSGGGGGGDGVGRFSPSLPVSFTFSFTFNSSSFPRRKEERKTQGQRKTENPFDTPPPPLSITGRSFCEMKGHLSVVGWRAERGRHQWWSGGSFDRLRLDFRRQPRRCCSAASLQDNKSSGCLLYQFIYFFIIALPLKKTSLSITFCCVTFTFLQDNYHVIWWTFHLIL